MSIGLKLLGDIALQRARFSCFKTYLLERGYPENVIQKTLSEVTFEDRNQALRQKKTRKSYPV